MDNKLYKLMNWPRIEAIIYSEESAPYEILGAHTVGKSVLFQTFCPEAKKISIVSNHGTIKNTMESVDEAGFFACLLPGKVPDDYEYEIEDLEGNIVCRKDAYNYPVEIPKKDVEKFNSGIHYSIYENLGAHTTWVKKQKGTFFAVWAPNALRVSVVGEFNHWDGRIYQMQKQEEIFTLFIPDVTEGDCYKYEVKTKAGVTFLKADPYAYGSQLRPNTASIVRKLQYDWSDEKWLNSRKQAQNESAPLSVYELFLGSFAKNKETDECLNYRDLAKKVVPYVKEMGYTHVELMPIMEYPMDASWGYQSVGYYAPTARYGSAEDFMFFIDTLHQAEIGIIIDWAPAQFPRDEYGLAGFDGTCLYEHLDPRKGTHPRWGTLIFNYGRPQVSNYLIANALYWVEKYHVDGIRMDAVAAMLYLDYGKNEGEWVANIYGGNENLEAIELLKHLNSIMKKRNPGVLMIAEDSSSYPELTTSLKDGGLGFDLKWNEGFVQDYLSYISYDPYFRAHHHQELTFSLIYAYSDKFILPFSHNEVVHGKASFLEKMPGIEEDKFANLRISYAYLFTHPGKKMLFMGQDFGDYNEFDETVQTKWQLLQNSLHLGIHQLIKRLNTLYCECPALYEKDYDASGFEWINNISSEKCMISFLRKAEKEEDTLVVTVNFANIDQEFVVGVPYRGKYKEILNTDEKEFGGKGRINARAKSTASEEYDGRPYCFKMTAAPLSASIFKYSPYTAKEELQISKKQEALIFANRAKEAKLEAEAARKEAKRAEEEAILASERAQKALKKALEAEQKAAKELEKLESQKKQKERK